MSVSWVLHTLSCYIFHSPTSTLLFLFFYHLPLPIVFVHFFLCSLFYPWSSMSSYLSLTLIVAFYIPGYDIIRTIRQSVIVSRIVYLFYRPNAPNDVSNFEELCSDKYPDAPPFQMTKVIPIDLLPQTKHVEIILIFQREPVWNI